jgi:type IV secretory pathway protease TraF
MTGSVKIASRVNAVVASEVQRAEDLALITGVLVARGLRPRNAERLPIDALARISTARNSANIALASLSLSDSFDSAFYPRLLAKIVFR